ncbi:MAG: bacterial Ig-like domain-containing protein, partial [Spirochaetaceae bacterium]|nr:bacterial Ig-like domain-containing protein [Spirochaetaceae bacterium]
MKNSLKSLRLKALAFCIPLFFLLTGCENPLFNTVTAELDYITVTKKPSVTLYELNESLDITGLEVTGTYTDRKTKRETVALEHITGYDSTVLGSQPLTVTVGGKTAVFTVFVAVEKLLSISVTGPDRTVFGLGEDIDLTGLVVTGHYADSTLCTEAVTSANISGYDSMTLGTKTIMVTVNGKTAYFTVTVTNARLVSIAVTAPPDRADYWWGEALDITGLKV